MRYKNLFLSIILLVVLFIIFQGLWGSGIAALVALGATLIFAFVLRARSAQETTQDEQPAARHPQALDLNALENTAPQPETASKHIVFNGLVYASVNDMPPDVRKNFERTMKFLENENQDSTLEATQEDGVFSSGVRRQLAAIQDPTERLKKLQNLRAKGQISPDEYEFRRKQILSET